MIEKFEYIGENDGISLLVLAAVHGNETAGTIACRRLIKEIEEGKIKIKNGRLTMVPVCNPEAHRRDVREIDQNLNRVMCEHKNPQNYEQSLANEICPLIKSHRVLLDLHSTHCEGDVPFAFCDYPDEYNQKLIDGLDVDYVLEGWPQIYQNQSEIEDYSTEHCAHEYGNTATTLECGYHKSPAAGDLAYHAILSTLASFGLTEAKKPQARAKKHIEMKNFVIKQREGQLTKQYKHLDKVKKGEVVARYDDGEELTASEDGYILLPNLNCAVGAEWYYFGSAK